MASRKTKDQFSPEIRRNWGFWDGRSDAEKGRTALWMNGRCHIHRAAHPLSKPYGEGYWAGYYGEAHPNTGEVVS